MRFSHRLRRLLGAAGLAITLAVGAAACGSDAADNTAQTSPTDHNAADVTFASDMIQHHAQALSMVDLTMGRPLDPEVQTLVEAIRTAQAPEIETMSGWLTAWGEPVPATMRDHTNAGHGDHGGSSESPADSMAGMDHGDTPGMMSAAEMASLAGAADAQFQDRWLELMVQHHEGAVAMAKTEQTEGQYADAVALAGTIAESQAAEIEQMNSLLGR